MSDAPQNTHSTPPADGSQQKTSKRKRSQRLIFCVQCGKEALTWSNVTKFCSKHCGELSRKTLARVCQTCNNEFKVDPASLRTNPGLYCSKACAHKARATGISGQIKPCEICGTPFFARSAGAKFRPQIACSRRCAMIWNWRTHRENHMEGAKKAAAKKIGRTPWNKGLPTEPAVIAKAKLKRQNFRDQFIAVRGGNGTGMSKTEQMASEMLSATFHYNLAIPTKEPRGSGYPTCYKVDFGDPVRKIAIEVDGSSHSSLVRQAQDAKKTKLLTELGWLVLRISNLRVQQLYTTSKLVDLMTILLQEK